MFFKGAHKMGTRIKAAILLCLMSAAAYSVCGAYQSMHRRSQNSLPAELSAMLTPGEEAEYFLRESDGYVAVFETKRSRTPLSVTGIEASLLRDTDRQLLSRGIPVKNIAALLLLLEDLGS